MDLKVGQEIFNKESRSLYKILALTKFSGGCVIDEQPCKYAEDCYSVVMNKPYSDSTWRSQECSFCTKYIYEDFIVLRKEKLKRILDKQ